MIQVQNISKSFPGAHGSHLVLDGVSFPVPEGSITTIFGPNGCGKSTLVNIVAGLDAPTSGMVSGRDNVNGNLGYVFQDYRRSLLPWHTVEQNILFPLSIRGLGWREQRARLDEVIALTGIRLNPKQRVFSLSGGQAQATCILRALIVRPKLLILDEPFAALDYERTIALRDVLSNVSKSLGLTVLFISHDLDETIALGDQAVFLSKSPTKVEEILSVNLPYPRTIVTTTMAEFLEIKQQAVRIFDRCMNREQ